MDVWNNSPYQNLNQEPSGKCPTCLEWKVITEAGRMNGMCDDCYTKKSTCISCGKRITNAWDLETTSLGNVHKGCIKFDLAGFQKISGIHPGLTDPNIASGEKTGVQVQLSQRWNQARIDDFLKGYAGLCKLHRMRFDLDHDHMIIVTEHSREQLSDKVDIFQYPPAATARSNIKLPIGD